MIRETNGHYSCSRLTRRLFLDPTEINEDREIAWNLFEAALDWCVTPEVSE
ncbi:MAG: hypothetical protein R3C11_10270 [Planctomycetaceae bacterium]